MKIVICHFLSKIFSRYQKFPGKQKCSVTKIFTSVLSHKEFGQNLDAPSCAWKFSIKVIFWNTKVFSYEIFCYSETKTFRRKNLIPPLLSIKCFSFPDFLWNTEWFHGENFAVLWVKKIFNKTMKLPPSFAWKISIPEFFRNTEKFSHELYRHCELRIFQRSLVKFPSYAYNFAVHGIFWNTEVFLNEIFWYCVTKRFWRRNVIPPHSLMR